MWGDTTPEPNGFVGYHNNIILCLEFNYLINVQILVSHSRYFLMTIMELSVHYLLTNKGANLMPSYPVAILDRFLILSNA